MNKKQIKQLNYHLISKFMEVIIKIPDVTVTLASAIIAQDCASNEHDEQLIKDAVKNCNEAPVTLDLKNIAGDDEAQQLNLALAIFAISAELKKLELK